MSNNRFKLNQNFLKRVSSSEPRTKRVKTSKLIGVLLAAALASAALAAAEDNKGKKPSRIPLPTVHIYKGEQCVEPTAVMRRDHMKFILHQRDETMHRGIRTSKHSLKECVNCHADPKTGSVLGKEGFCESCHTYAAVTMDCFGCHTPLAEPETGQAAGFRGTQALRSLARSVSTGTEVSR